MSTLSEQFLAEIEAFLALAGMDATNFGREALNDPNFVFDLRKGDRSPSARTIDKVRDFIRIRSKPPSVREKQVGAAAE